MPVRVPGLGDALWGEVAAMSLLKKVLFTQNTGSHPMEVGVGQAACPGDAL